MLACSNAGAKSEAAGVLGGETELTEAQQEAVEALWKHFAPETVLLGGEGNEGNGLEETNLVTAEEVKELDFSLLPLYVLDVDAFVENLEGADVADYIRQDPNHILLCGKHEGEPWVLSEMLLYEGKWRKSLFSMQDRHGLNDFFDWAEQCGVLVDDGSARLLDVSGNKYLWGTKDGKPVFFFYGRTDSFDLDGFVMRVVARAKAREEGRIC